MGARKQSSGGLKGRTERDTAPGRKGGPQSVAPLEFDPFTPGREHPEWVRKNFPDYVEQTHEALVRSVRTLESHGHLITITTAYEVRVDGHLVTLHMMVDEQGQLWSHLCPYQSFTSATELVRHLLDRLPHLFEGTNPAGHGGHTHPSAGEHGGAS
jgi:hypothetical protein